MSQAARSQVYLVMTEAFTYVSKSSYAAHETDLPSFSPDNARKRNIKTAWTQPRSVRRLSGFSNKPSFLHPPFGQCGRVKKLKKVDFAPLFTVGRFGLAEA
jgi:hypothetical protein